MSENPLLVDRLAGARIDLAQGEIDAEGLIELLRDAEMRIRTPLPLPLTLTCPSCNGRHIDEGIWATKPHHTHACQHCGLTWRPAIVNTVGVQFLPGFKNGD